LRQAYKAYNITFTDSKQNSDHAYAAASRSIERRMLIDFAKEIGSNILIAGANITAMMPYILDPNYNFHLCCPIIDGRDTSRHIDHAMKINYNNISADNINRVKESVCNKTLQQEMESIPNETSHSSLNNCEECDIKADFGVFCHSFYDMTPTNVADIMDKHDLATAYGTVVFSSEILINNKSLIPILNMHYSKNKREDEIYMDFKNDNSTGYKHKLSNYISLMTQMYYISSKNNMYSVEFMNNINGIQFFKIARTSNINTMTYRTLWLTEEDKVCVRLPVRNNCIYDDDDNDEIDFEWIAFPKMLVNDTRSYLDKLSLDKIDYLSAISFIASVNHKLISSGNVWKTSYKINADEISRLATVLSVQARKNHIDNIDLHRRKNLANKENMEVKKKNIFFLLIKAIQYQIKRLCPKMLRSLRKITCSVYR